MYTEIKNFQGGLADSDYRGLPGSFAPGSYGLDIHDKSGLLRANWKLTKDSGSTVTDLIIHGFAGSDGSTYFGGDSGKLYKRTSGGSWSNVRTESARITGFTEYNGYFMWSVSNKLFRMLIAGDWTDGAVQVYKASTTSWSSTLTDVTWTGNEVDTSWHLMSRLGVDLYIGAGQYITYVTTAFVVSIQALDLAPNWVVKPMAIWNDNILFGASNAATDESALFTWDGFSDSWSNQIPVPEPQVHAIASDGQIAYVKAGTQGNIYTFSSNGLTPIKQIPGDYTLSATEIVYPNALNLKNGKLLLGLSKNGGNPANEGVYTFGSPYVNYTKVLDLSYVVSQAVLSAIEIGAIIQDSGNTFIAWKDTTGAAAYGVDKIDYSNRYATATYITTLIGGNKPDAIMARLAVNFKKLPASCTIDLSYRKNGDTSWTALGSQVTTLNKTNYLVSQPIKFETIQFRLILGGNSTNTPEINSINMEYERPNIMS